MTRNEVSSRTVQHAKGPTFESTLEETLVILVSPVDRDISGVGQDPSHDRIGEKRVLDLEWRRYLSAMNAANCPCHIPNNAAELCAVLCCSKLQAANEIQLLLPKEGKWSLTSITMFA